MYCLCFVVVVFCCQLHTDLCVFRDSIKTCIQILLHNSNTNGRLARAYFRQSLIYEDAGLPEEADVARSEARHYRKIVVGDSKELVDDTMKDYDILDHNP